MTFFLLFGKCIVTKTRIILIYQHHSHHLNKCFPYCFFGDERRGLRKASIQVISWEMVFTSSTFAAIQKTCKAAGGKWDFDMLTKLQANTCWELLLGAPSHHVYHFCAAALCLQVLSLVVEDLAALFHSGINCEGETWYPIIGVKGDAPALSKLGAFTRSFNHLHGGGGICHHCLAGRGGHMWEDITRNASWLQTLYQERRWKPEKPSHVLPIPFSDLAP